MTSGIQFWEQPLVQFGLGAFETMHAFDGNIPLIDFHLSRLQNALTKWQSSNFDLKKEWDLVSENLSNDGEFRVKWLLGLDKNNNILHHLYQFPYQKATTPLKLLARPCFQLNPQTFKSSAYAEHWLELKHATQQGFDDVIYLDTQNNLIECSKATLLSTQHDHGTLASGANLNSVSAQALKTLQPNYWKREPLALKNLSVSSQLWACNALHGMMHINSIQNDLGEVLYQYKGTEPKDVWTPLLFKK